MSKRCMRPGTCSSVGISVKKTSNHYDMHVLLLVTSYHYLQGLNDTFERRVIAVFPKALRLLSLSFPAGGHHLCRVLREDKTSLFPSKGDCGTYVTNLVTLKVRVLRNRNPFFLGKFKTHQYESNGIPSNWHPNEARRSVGGWMEALTRKRGVSRWTRRTPNEFFSEGCSWIWWRETMNVGG